MRLRRCRAPVRGIPRVPPRRRGQCHRPRRNAWSIFTVRPRSPRGAWLLVRTTSVQRALHRHGSCVRNGARDGPRVGIVDAVAGLALAGVAGLAEGGGGRGGDDGDAGGVAWGYDDWFECYYDHCTVDETATVGCHDDAFCCVAPGDARVPICLCMPNHFGDGVESCERCPGGWSSTSPAGARALTDCVARDVDAGYGYYDDDDDGCNVPASYFLLILIFVGVSMLACVWCPFLFERREEANFADYFATCVVSVFGCSFSGIPALAMSLACGPATAVLYFLFIAAICTGCWFWRKKKQPTEQGPPPAQRAVAQAEPSRYTPIRSNPCSRRQGWWAWLVVSRFRCQCLRSTSAECHRRQRRQLTHPPWPRSLLYCSHTTGCLYKRTRRLLCKWKRPQ
jgi:hypothetical protein